MEAQALTAILGVTFRDPALLRQALLHRSYAREMSLPALDTNERLEFLGDAVLDLIVAEHLFRHHPDLPEGELTKARAMLVNSSFLSRLAERAGIGEQVLLSRDERADGGQAKTSILADTLEAVIGAIFIDQGLDTARDAVIEMLADDLENLVEKGVRSDFKTELQELAVQLGHPAPRYDMEDEGPDHAKVFHSRVYLGSSLMGKGAGRSKKEAEQAAAAELLRHLSHRD